MSTTRTLTLRPPEQSTWSAPDLDESQQAVVDLKPGHGPVLVLGGPGTGRTTVAVEYAIKRLVDGTSPEELLVLTPSRQSATRLRDHLTARAQAEGLGTRAETPVRSFASYAFDLIRRMRLDGYLPFVSEPPRLLAGAEQDRLIDELLASYDELPSGPEWPESVNEAVGLRGFRQEVRELIDRTQEYGLTPGRIQELGEERNLPEWVAVAQVLQDYLDRLDLPGHSAFDPASLITTAADFWEQNPEFTEAERKRLPVIIVDDLQDANPSIFRLLRLLGADQDVVATASPANVAQGFRGADPQQLGTFLKNMRTQPQAGTPDREDSVFMLTQQHRMHPEIQQSWERLNNRIPAVPGLPQITMEPLDTDEPSAVQVHHVASDVQEQLLIQQQILQLHFEQGVPYDQIAVISRSASRAGRIAKKLELEGIPVHRRAAEIVLNQEPAVAPLLTLIRAASVTDAEDAPLTASQAAWLLTGRYGAATELQLRALRRRLITVERSRNGARSSDELLLEALLNPESLTELLDLQEDWSLPSYARPVRRIATMLAAMTECVGSDTDSDPGSVLWAGWEASGAAEVWERAALGTDPYVSLRAHRDLDAVVALFDAAERFSTQLPGQSALGFTEYLDNQDLPMDSLSSQASLGAAVQVLTPSSAADQEWEAVIIVGVQEGTWPNTRLRGQLLHLDDLVDIARGRETVQTYQDRVASVRADETRTFALAISRARRWLIASAVATEEQQPSSFLDRVSPWKPTEEHVNRPLTTVAVPLNRSHLVATLRRQLEDYYREHPEEDLTDAPEEIHNAARALASLAQAGETTADPAHWWGLAPITAPSTEDSAKQKAPRRVRMSPSGVDTALENPLSWFMKQAGITPDNVEALNVGTFVHYIAECVPDADEEKITELFQQEFPTLLKSLSLTADDWQAQTLKNRITKMLKFYIGYVAHMESASRSFVGAEISVRDTLTFDDIEVLISAKIDRLEVTENGEFYVIDLKTGKSAPTAAQMEHHPQLGIYQLMIQRDAIPQDYREKNPKVDALTGASAGAALVQLGSQTKKLKTQEQSPIDSDQPWPYVLIEVVARRTDLSSVLDIQHRKARDPELPEVSPIAPEGKQVTEWVR